MGSFLGHALPGKYFLPLHLINLIRLILPCPWLLGFLQLQQELFNFKVECLNKALPYILELNLILQPTFTISTVVILRRQSKTGYINRATHQGSTRLPWESALKLTAFSVQLVLSSLPSLSIICF